MFIFQLRVNSAVAYEKLTIYHDLKMPFKIKRSLASQVVEAAAVHRREKNSFVWKGEV